MRQMLWVLWYIVILSVVITGICLTARSQSNPMLPLFTDSKGMNCGSGCILGIVPGKTTLNEARNAIKLHPLTSNFSEQTTQEGNVNFLSKELTISLTLNGLKVQRISVFQFQQTGSFLPEANELMLETSRSLTIGNVINLFGSDDFSTGLSYTDNAGLNHHLIIQCFNKARLCASLTDSLTPTSPITLTVLPNEGPLENYLAPGVLVCHKWMGFKLINYYTDPQHCD